MQDKALIEYCNKQSQPVLSNITLQLTHSCS